jgi:hypothetical protein
MKNKPEKLVCFAGHDCVVQAERYASNGHTALSIYDAKTGEYVATASLNVAHVPLAPNQVFIKDYSENEGMLKALEEAGIVRVSGVYVPTGIGSLPVCELLIPPPEQDREPRRQAGPGKQARGDWLEKLATDMLAESRPKSNDRDFGRDR